VRWAGIRKAAAWYNAHVSLMHPATRGLPNQNVPAVVLMTDDLANRQKAEKDGIVSISGAFMEMLFDVDNVPSVFDSSQICSGHERFQSGVGFIVRGWVQ
jgi:hypothetical protein